MEDGWSNGQGSSRSVVLFYFLTIYLAIFELRQPENETSSSFTYTLTKGDSRRRTVLVKKARTKSKLNSVMQAALWFRNFMRFSSLI